MDLWDEVGRDYEAELHTARMETGLAALAEYREIAVRAVDENDLDNRLAMMAKAFDKAASIAVPAGGVDAAVVRNELHEAVRTEWASRNRKGS